MLLSLDRRVSEKHNCHLYCCTVHYRLCTARRRFGGRRRYQRGNGSSLPGGGGWPLVSSGKGREEFPRSSTEGVGRVLEERLLSTFAQVMSDRSIKSPEDERGFYKIV